MPAPFDLQGHRGARGLKPENTLPGFEVALDLGVTSIETDVHLTRDRKPVLYHDAAISPKLCRRMRPDAAPAPSRRPPINSLGWVEVCSYIADRNPDRRRFPCQDASVTPLAALYAEKYRIDPYAIPLLDTALHFVSCYAGPLGKAAGKTAVQRRHAQRVRFDLELKWVPFHAESAGDESDDRPAALLAPPIIDSALAERFRGRIAVRSFDHRLVRALRPLMPTVTFGVLIAETAPVDPVAVTRQAGADVYCPDYRFLDRALLRQCHGAGVRVVPWTVNDEADWLRLLDWGVDGITTDYPDRLAALLRKHRVPF